MGAGERGSVCTTFWAAHLLVLGDAVHLVRVQQTPGARLSTIKARLRSQPATVVSSSSRNKRRGSWQQFIEI